MSRFYHNRYYTIDMKIYVCSKSEVALITGRVGATHVLSLLDPGDRPVLHLSTPLQNWLLINFDDTRNEFSANAPTEDDVIKFMEWAKKLPNDAILLVHCFAGVSRSTAAAMAILVQYYGKDKIDECIKMVHDVRPQACPNPIITQIADTYLGCNGEFHQKAQGSSPFSELLKLV